MAKVQREMITVSASYYNFNERYESAMAHLDDETIRVITVNLLSRKETDDSIEEKYIVFYQEIEVDEDGKLPRHGYYRGASKTMFRLDELSDLDWNAPIHTVTIYRDIIFEEMKLTPGDIMNDLNYWQALQEKEDGILNFVVDEETLS